MAILMAVVATPSFGQSIWTNPITGTNPGLTSPYTTGDVRDANITVSGITRGGGLTGNVANNRYNANGWSTGGIVANDYFEFTLTPNAGYRIDFSSLVYTGQASGTGPTVFSLRLSVDSYAANIGAATASGTTISLTAGTFQNITGAISFRLYAWSAGGASGTYSVNDFTFNGSVNSTCPSVTLTSVLPTSGPVGTEVTIQAAGGLTGATVTFSGIAATIVSTTATQLVVTVPAGASTGNLVVKDASLCASTPVPFTVINQDITSCEGNSSFTDIIISEIFDEATGSGGGIELFNPTAAAINLTTNDYRLRRYADNGPTFTELDFGSISIPSGGTILITAVASPLPSCGGLTYQATLGTGYNENDRFELRKNGTTVIDVAYGASIAGYSVLRNTTAVGPTATYNAADWSISTTPDCSDLGYFPPITKLAPNLTVSPSVSLSCTTTSVTLNAAGTEGHVGGNALAYQWYYLAPATNVWTIVTNNVNYSGATGPALTITPPSSFNNYQYYCQIRENSATCYKASNATIIKDIYFTTWNSPGTWSNGVPSLTKRAIINFNYDTTTHGSFEACSVVVNATFTLNITPSQFVAIQNDLTVNGTLTVQDDGSLVQISDAGVNTGSITSNRNVNLGKYDYVYWSSPVAAFPVTSVSTGTATNFIYKWNPTQAGSYGIWVNANENMVAGKGYIVRGPTAFPTTPTAFSAAFTGVPNNGVVNATIQRGSYTGPNYPNANGVIVTNKDDNWNLVGNPYPSSIYARDFLLANTNIEGAVRIWTHGSQPSSAVTDPFYGNFLYNYNSNDYIVHNGTGTVSGPAGFSGYIASGQGFFIQMNDGVASTQTVTFNNAMRNKTYTNANFYRSAHQNQNVKGLENEGETDQGRLWIDLVSAAGNVSRTLVGYVEGATLAKDRMYDAYGKLDENQNFYTLINDEAMTIQGRPVPFDPSDLVPLGLHLASAGNYKIAIAATDGLFQGEETNLFLEDKTLGILHNLRLAPYDFTAEAGTLDTRFVLRYTNTTLGNPEFDVNANNVVVATNKNIAVKSYLEPIASVTIFDLLGRKIFDQSQVHANELKIDTVPSNQQTLIVRISLQNGQKLTRKIIF
ncbi:T9SS sorting signal type C domain-containing protein [Flavobacterium sp.]|uniref:T9SS sorting signal type C domain-containing protein n=1 Tax=Flavobacterium sp. TaxID=239 RepID=UPI0039E5A82B